MTHTTNNVTANITYSVVAAYAHAGYERNDIISTHKSYELAMRAVKAKGWACHRSIRATHECA